MEMFSLLESYINPLLLIIFNYTYYNIKNQQNYVRKHIKKAYTPLNFLFL